MMRPSKPVVYVGIVSLVGTLLLLVALLMQPGAIPLRDGAAPAALPELVARGEYIARAGDCAACHTTPRGKPFAGGLAMQTPFGTIVSTNITPDRETGIGGWTEEAFARALRRGISADGHLLYPAMPYTAYTKVSDADIHALKAYFDTVAPVRAVTPANNLPFPFSVRQIMLGWNLLFFHDRRFIPNRSRSEQWNRGAYLVDGLGHCAACHSAKNMLGGDKAYLQGGVLQGWYAPELSANRYIGLGAWSRDDIVAYLRDGANNRAVAAGPMAEAVEHSTQHLTTADLSAIAKYLKDLTGSNRAPPQALAMDDIRINRGAALYRNNCAACHRSDGNGVATMLPAFAGSPTVQAPDSTNLVRTVLEGGAAAVTRNNPTGARMPAFAWKLDDQQVADVLTYIRNTWGNRAEAVPPGIVAKARARAKE